MALRMSSARCWSMMRGSLRPSPPVPAYLFSSSIPHPNRSLHFSPRRLVLSSISPQSTSTSLPSSTLPSTVLPAVTSSSPPARGPTSTSDSATPILTALDAAVAPLPCAYTPPEIAPLLSVKDVAKAMEAIIVSNEGEGKEAEGAEKAKGEGLSEKKGLEALVADVTAKEEAHGRTAARSSAA